MWNRIDRMRIHYIWSMRFRIHIPEKKLENSASFIIFQNSSLGKSTKANLDDTMDSEDGEIVQYKVTVLTKVTL